MSNLYDPTRIRQRQNTDIGQESSTGANLVKDTIYKAASDGMLVAFCYPYCTGIKVKADDVSPPTLMRGCNSSAQDSPFSSSVCVLIKKGEYWKVESNEIGGSTTYLRWFPIY